MIGDVVATCSVCGLDVGVPAIRVVRPLSNGIQVVWVHSCGGLGSRFLLPGEAKSLAGRLQRRGERSDLEPLPPSGDELLLAEWALDLDGIDTVEDFDFMWRGRKAVANHDGAVPTDT